MSDTKRSLVAHNFSKYSIPIFEISEFHGARVQGVGLWGLLFLLPAQCLKIYGLVEISKAKRENLFIIVVKRGTVIFLLF